MVSTLPPSNSKPTSCCSNLIEIQQASKSVKAIHNNRLPWLQLLDRLILVLQYHLEEVNQHTTGRITAMSMHVFYFAVRQNAAADVLANSF